MKRKVKAGLGSVVLVGSIFCVLIYVSAITWIGDPSNMDNTTVEEEVDGNIKSVHRYDENGRRHGLQEVYFNGQLIHERMVEHGSLLWSKEYKLDGTVKDHLVEDDDYNLIPRSNTTPESNQTN